MRRLVALACAAALLPVAAATAGAAQKPPDRVLVRGIEFDLTLSKQRVRPGRVIVQFVNDGEDPHDLRLQRRDGGEEVGVGEVAPGDYASLDLRLPQRSRYRLWCSIGVHRAAGMEATLATKRKRR